VTAGPFSLRASEQTACAGADAHNSAVVLHRLAPRKFSVDW
jgi:hypothetical protein